MDKSAVKKSELLENNANVSTNGCDINWQISDIKNHSCSQEMFSDDDQLRNSTFYSPKVTSKNGTFNSSISIRTPLLCSKVAQETPGRAVEPKTPAELLPFITKTNFIWTSDMETPQSKLNDKPESCNKTVNSVDINNTTPTRGQFTPNYEDMKANAKVTTSPIFGGKRRSKKRAKRRILNNLNLEIENSNEQQSSISSNSDRVPSEAASTISNDLAVDLESENLKSNTKPHNEATNQECQENKKLEEATGADKNTSTQEFFCNASFSSIDRLCNSTIQEEKAAIAKDEIENKNTNIKQEMIDEKENKSNNVLERVVAIRRNQKPVRRSTDISHTVIPKEIFSKSAMELEMANTKFSQEKKEISKIQRKSLKLISFSKLSSLENETPIKIEKSTVQNPSVEKSEFKYSTQDIPVEIMNDWNMESNKCDQLNQEGSTRSINPVNKLLTNAVGKEEIQREADNNNFPVKLKEIDSKVKLEILTPDNNLNKITDGFSTAGGKNIAISEQKIINYAKIYEEIENENLNENSFLCLKKNKIVQKKLLNVGTKSMSDKQLVAATSKKENGIMHLNKKTCITKSEKLQLYEDLDLKEFLKPKLSPENLIANNIDFSTAGDTNIKIIKEEENENSILEIKENEMPKLNTKQSVHNQAITVFDKKESNLLNKPTVFSEKLEPIAKPSTVTTSITSKISDFKVPCTKSASDGFSTAGGKGIKISEEKEKQFLNIYNELGDIDENSFLDLKKSKISKSNVNRRSKPLIVFNKKEFNLDNNISMIDSIKKNDNTAQVKLSVSSDTDEAFYNLGDVEQFFVHSNQHNLDENKEDTVKNCFAIPNSLHGLKKAKQDSKDVEHIKSTLMSDVQKKKILNTNVEKDIKNSIILFKNGNGNENGLSDNDSIFTSEPEKKYTRILKRKLENCEPKRTERSRSFGGFPVSNEGVSASKLNKSDPQNESFINQPLEKGLSVSQVFDQHSDSWLCKVELSYLNGSKIKSPDLIKTETKAGENVCIPSEPQSQNNDFLGFTFKECTESFRSYASLKKIVDKYEENAQFIVEVGKTISISNQTTLRQYLTVQCENNVDIRKGLNQTNYILIPKSQAISYKVPEAFSLRINKERLIDKNNLEKVIEKRKHADTDSDTPLTTLKKPRIGSDLQGRKLFSGSDESDFEENKTEINSEHQDVAESSLHDSEKILIEAVEEQEDLSAERLEAILQQEKMIRNKRRIKIKPTMGSLLKQRLANSKNRISWCDLVGNAMPTARSLEQIKRNDCDSKILDITASNAACYKFLTCNIIGNKKTISLDVGDGAILIFDENGHAGVEEFAQAFLAMPGVDPKLLPTGWVENHYRWIIWKLASVDRKNFNSTLIPKMLTPERVMNEIKYRYDREIDRAERPAIRKILEKDSTPSQRMVLCISSIKENKCNGEIEKETRSLLGFPRYKIEATDGWYSIPLTVDNMMINYISSGKLKEGTKIITYGAELLDCERGFHPLEKPGNVSLKIHTNCTRRVRWDTKLGYQKISKPIPVKLRDIVMGGGLVGETTAVAARVYPLLYREKTPDGQSIFRNARCEEKVAIAHERTLESKLDAMYAEAHKNFDSKKKFESDEEIVQSSQNSSKSQARKRNSDHWEKKQEEFKQRLELEVQQGLPPPRQVTPVLKVRLFDDKTTVTLTIWGVSEDSGYDIKEGNTITVYNSFAMGSRGGELNLTANRMTHIKTEPLLKLPYPCRTCTPISNIVGSSFDPNFGEIDTVGIVVSSGPAPHGMKNFEMVNLASPNPNNSRSSYLSILFWNGVVSFGYQGMFTPGSLIACSNLEWRRSTSWSIAVTYCSEKTVFTCNPRQPHLLQELRNLKTLVRNPVAYAETCAEEILVELSKKPQPRSNQNTPTGWSNRLSLISPMKTYSPGNPTIQKRLEKLSCYGTTNDISPVLVRNSSTKVNKDFTPVTRRS